MDIDKAIKKQKNCKRFCIECKKDFKKQNTPELYFR